MSIVSITLLAWAVAAPAEVLTLPCEQRPAWLRDDGIVMAGSWEPLPFRAQRDCGADEMPSPAQKAGYALEQSPQMVRRLKDLGVTFVMTHAYKGLGFVAEQESMLDAIRFTALCHDAGMHVGVYCNSGTLFWKQMFAELPESAGWLTLNHLRLPIMYGYAPYRYRWDRNHPDAAALHREIVRFSVQGIRADLLHFDNYNVGPGSELNAQRRFRTFLNAHFGPAQLRDMGVPGNDPILLPLTKAADPLLHRAWAVFASDSLAASYYDLTRYARQLRRDVLLELNPGGPGDRIRPPVDHGRMLGGGEAFWDEGERPGVFDGKLHTRIRTYKVARAMDNIAFAYTMNPLEAAESMAFNLDCLGCICWFEYGEILEMPGSTKPMSPLLAPYVQFYRSRRDLFREGAVVADVAVLRSFASQVFAEPSRPALTARVEQELIEQRIPFQILYDEQLPRLQRYPVLVLAGCVALSNEQIELIRQYVSSGGSLLMVGPTATHDEWYRPRAEAGFARLDSPRVLQIEPADSVASTLQEKRSERLSARIDAPQGVCAELIRQKDRYLVHLVNYTGQAARDIRVHLRVPVGTSVESVRLVSPDHPAEEAISPATSDGHVHFTVPRLDVYVIASVTLRQGPP